MKTTILLPLLAALAAGLCLGAYPARATEIGGINIHGSASLTASYSDKWDFGGNTADNPSLNRVDVILNGVHRFDNGIKAGAQLYAYKFANYRDIALDWAGLDYAWNEKLGLRVGRNKTPMGLYNETQDLDAIRTFASLPLSFYPRTQRSITTSVDGLSVYGSIGVGKIGTFEYEGYFGRKDRIPGDSPAMRGFSGLMQVDEWKFVKPSYGLGLTWNTPVEGLRFVYTLNIYPNNKISGHLATTSQLLPSQMGTPTMVDNALGAGTWNNSGLFAGTEADLNDLRVTFRTAGVEYALGKWVFAAEYRLFDLYGATRYIPAFTRLGLPATTPNAPMLTECYYGQVTYQATSKLGFGVYGCRELLDRKASNQSNPLGYQNDYAAAVSYALTKWCVVKLEGHQMVGWVRLNRDGARNLLTPTTNKNWNYFSFQTVISF